MDQYQKPQTVYHQFILKKTLQYFIVSVFLLSFLLSYSSVFSTLLLTHTIERKYMFLICNGIVAFLAKSSGFSSSSPTELDFNGELAKTTNEADVKPVPKPSGSTNEADVKLVPKSSGSTEAIEAAMGGSNLASPENVGREEEEENESLIPAESAEEEGNELNLDADELKRKFDEFIKKMKEEIRIGVQ